MTKTNFTPNTLDGIRASREVRLLVSLLAFDRALLAATGRSRFDSLASPNRPAVGFK